MPSEGSRLSNTKQRRPASGAPSFLSTRSYQGTATQRPQSSSPLPNFTYDVGHTLLRSLDEEVARRLERPPFEVRLGPGATASPGADIAGAAHRSRVPPLHGRTQNLRHVYSPTPPTPSPRSLYSSRGLDYSTNMQTLTSAGLRVIPNDVAFFPTTGGHQSVAADPPATSQYRPRPNSAAAASTGMLSIRRPQFRYQPLPERLVGKLSQMSPQNAGRRESPPMSYTSEGRSDASPSTLSSHTEGTSEGRYFDTNTVIRHRGDSDVTTCSDAGSSSSSVILRTGGWQGVGRGAWRPRSEAARVGEVSSDGVCFDSDSDAKLLGHLAARQGLAYPSAYPSSTPGLWASVKREGPRTASRQPHQSPETFPVRGKLTAQPPHLRTSETSVKRQERVGPPASHTGHRHREASGKPPSRRSHPTQDTPMRHGATGPRPFHALTRQSRRCVCCPVDVDCGQSLTRALPPPAPVRRSLRTLRRHHEDQHYVGGHASEEEYQDDSVLLDHLMRVRRSTKGSRPRTAVESDSRDGFPTGSATPPVEPLYPCKPASTRPLRLYHDPDADTPSNVLRGRRPPQRRSTWKPVTSPPPPPPAPTEDVVQLVAKSVLEELVKARIVPPSPPKDLEAQRSSPAKSERDFQSYATSPESLRSADRSGSEVHETQRNDAGTSPIPSLHSPSEQEVVASPDTDRHSTSPERSPATTPSHLSANATSVPVNTMTLPPRHPFVKRHPSEMSSRESGPPSPAAAGVPEGKRIDDASSAHVETASASPTSDSTSSADSFVHPRAPVSHETPAGSRTVAQTPTNESAGGDQGETPVVQASQVTAPSSSTTEGMVCPASDEDCRTADEASASPPQRQVNGHATPMTAESCMQASTDLVPLSPHVGAPKEALLSGSASSPPTPLFANDLAQASGTVSASSMSHQSPDVSAPVCCVEHNGSSSLGAVHLTTPTHLVHPSTTDAAMFSAVTRARIELLMDVEAASRNRILWEESDDMEEMRRSHVTPIRDEASRSRQRTVELNEHSAHENPPTAVEVQPEENVEQSVPAAPPAESEQLANAQEKEPPHDKTSEAHVSLFQLAFLEMCQYTMNELARNEQLARTTMCSEIATRAEALGRSSILAEEEGGRDGITRDESIARLARQTEALIAEEASSRDYLADLEAVPHQELGKRFLLEATFSSTLLTLRQETSQALDTIVLCLREKERAAAEAKARAVEAQLGATITLEEKTRSIIEQTEAEIIVELSAKIVEYHESVNRNLLLRSASDAFEELLEASDHDVQRIHLSETLSQKLAPPPHEEPPHRESASTRDTGNGDAQIKALTTTPTGLPPPLTVVPSASDALGDRSPSSPFAYQSTTDSPHEIHATAKPLSPIIRPLASMESNSVNHGSALMPCVDPPMTRSVSPTEVTAASRPGSVKEDIPSNTLKAAAAGMELDVQGVQPSASASETRITETTDESPTPQLANAPASTVTTTCNKDLLSSERGQNVLCENVSPSASLPDDAAAGHGEPNPSLPNAADGALDSKVDGRESHQLLEKPSGEKRTRARRPRGRGFLYDVAALEEDEAAEVPDDNTYREGGSQRDDEPRARQTLNLPPLPPVPPLSFAAVSGLKTEPDVPSDVVKQEVDADLPVQSKPLKRTPTPVSKLRLDDKDTYPYFFSSAYDTHAPASSTTGPGKPTDSQAQTLEASVHSTPASTRSAPSKQPSTSGNVRPPSPPLACNESENENSEWDRSDPLMESPGSQQARDAASSQPITATEGSSSNGDNGNTSYVAQRLGSLSTRGSGRSSVVSALPLRRQERFVRDDAADENQGLVNAFSDRIMVRDSRAFLVPSSPIDDFANDSRASFTSYAESEMRRAAERVDVEPRDTPSTREVCPPLKSLSGTTSSGGDRPFAPLNAVVHRPVASSAGDSSLAVEFGERRGAGAYRGVRRTSDAGSLDSVQEEEEEMTIGATLDTAAAPEKSASLSPHHSWGNGTHHSRSQEGRRRERLVVVKEDPEISSEHDAPDRGEVAGERGEDPPVRCATPLFVRQAAFPEDLWRPSATPHTHPLSRPPHGMEAGADQPRPHGASHVSGNASTANSDESSWKENEEDNEASDPLLETTNNDPQGRARTHGHSGVIADHMSSMASSPASSSRTSRSERHHDVLSTFTSEQKDASRLAQLTTQAIDAHDASMDSEELREAPIQQSVPLDLV